MIDPTYIEELVAGMALWISEDDTLGPLYQWIDPRPEDALDYEPGGTKTPIYVTRIPETRERGLALTFYQELAPTPGYDLSEVMIQVKWRGGTEPFEGIRRMGAVHARLHELSSVQMGRVRVSLIMGGGLATIGPDGNGRHQYTQNYRVRGSGHVLPE